MEAGIKILEGLYRINIPLLRKIIEKIIVRKEGGYCFSPSIRRIYSKYYGLSIGYGTYGGCFIHDNFPGPCDITFGRYCSVGSHLKIFRANHPADNFSSHPFMYNPRFGYVKEDKLCRPPITIGNDVWIGSSVIICPRVTVIGDGAIIGAGSVVTHNVEPYSIIAGNPASEIRKRFNDKQIEYLQGSKWWELDIESLKAVEPELSKGLYDLI